MLKKPDPSSNVSAQSTLHQPRPFFSVYPPQQFVPVTYTQGSPAQIVNTLKTDPTIDLSTDQDIQKERKATLIKQIKQEGLQAELETELLRAQVEALKIKNELDRVTLDMARSGHYQKMQQLEAEALLVQTKNHVEMDEFQKEHVIVQTKLAEGSLKTYQKEEESQRSLDDNFSSHHRGSIFS